MHSAQNVHLPLIVPVIIHRPVIICPTRPPIPIPVVIPRILVSISITRSRGVPLIRISRRQATIVRRRVVSPRRPVLLIHGQRTPRGRSGFESVQPPSIERAWTVTSTVQAPLPPHLLVPPSIPPHKIIHDNLPVLFPDVPLAPDPPVLTALHRPRDDLPRLPLLLVAEEDALGPQLVREDARDADRGEQGRGGLERLEGRGLWRGGAGLWFPCGRRRAAARR